MGPPATFGHDPPMHPERRVLRTPDPSGAIRMFLARNATDPGLRAAVVSCDQGLLLGGVGSDDLDVLAAVGAALHAGISGMPERCANYGLRADEVHTQSVRVGPTELVVTSLGAPLGAMDGMRGALARLMAA